MPKGCVETSGRAMKEVSRSFEKLFMDSVQERIKVWCNKRRLIGLSPPGAAPFNIDDGEALAFFEIYAEDATARVRRYRKDMPVRIAFSKNLQIRIYGIALRHHVSR
jgi:hypothetical protein